MSAEQRREQLLDATKTIVDRSGFHAVSIEAVAREAGITRPVVYGHFEDLSGLLEALVERESARALAQLARVLPTDLAAGDPRDQLLGGLRGYLRAAEADPVTWRLVLMPPEGAPDVLREHIARGRAAVVAQLAEAVRPRPRPGPRGARSRAHGHDVLFALRRRGAPAAHRARALPGGAPGRSRELAARTAAGALGVPAVATIGVYGFDLDSFLAALREANVRQLLDVRQRRGVRGPEYAWANSQRLQGSPG